MIFWSIPTTSKITENTSVVFCLGSKSMVICLTRQMWVPQDSSWISQLYPRTQRSSDGLWQNQDHTRLAWTLKIKDIQSFLGFTNFYHCFIHGILTSLFHSPDLLTRVLSGILHQNVVWLSKHLRKHSQQLWSWLTGPSTHKSTLKLAHPTMHWQLCSLSTHPKMSYTWSLSIHELSPHLNWITMYMRRNFLLFSKPSNVGDTILRDMVHQLT